MEQFFSSIMRHGDTIIVAIVAIILGWDRVRSGSGILQKQILDTYKERNQQLEDKLKTKEQEFAETIKELREAHNQTNIEFASLKATIIEKDKRIAELRDDLLGRNPEMVALLKEISASNGEIKKFMEMMHDDSKIERKHQTDLLEGQVRRGKNIDESSASGNGNPMRTSSKGSN